MYEKQFGWVCCAFLEKLQETTRDKNDAKRKRKLLIFYNYYHTIVILVIIGIVYDKENVTISFGAW